MVEASPGPVADRHQGPLLRHEIVWGLFLQVCQDHLPWSVWEKVSLILKPKRETFPGFLVVWNPPAAGDMGSAPRSGTHPINASGSEARAVTTAPVFLSWEPQQEEPRQ